MDIFLESFVYLNMYFIQITNFKININFIDILNRGNSSSSSKGVKNETLNQGTVLYYFNCKVKYFDKIGCIEKYSIYYIILKYRCY